MSDQPVSTPVWSRSVKIDGETEIKRASDRDPTRKAHQANFFFHNSHLSKNHATIRRAELGFQIQDNGSTFGTVLNHEVLKPHRWFALQQNDTLAFIIMKPLVSIRRVHSEHESSDATTIPLDQFGVASLGLLFVVSVRDNVVTLTGEDAAVPDAASANEAAELVEPQDLEFSDDDTRATGMEISIDELEDDYDAYGGAHTDAADPEATENEEYSDHEYLLQAFPDVDDDLDVACTAFCTEFAQLDLGLDYDRAVQLDLDLDYDPHTTGELPPVLLSSLTVESVTSRKRDYCAFEEDEEVSTDSSVSLEPSPKKHKASPSWTKTALKELGKGALVVLGTVAALAAYGSTIDPGSL